MKRMFTHLLLVGAGLMVLSVATSRAEPEPEPAVFVVDLDFTSEAGCAAWSPLNDTVMGGFSTSRFEPVEGAMRFSGQLSQDNRGGFASIRDKRQLRDLSATDGLELRVLGDGRTYSLMIWTDDTVDRVYYTASFTPTDGQWETLLLEWADFRPYFRGFWVAQKELDPSRIVSLGLMISDGETGPFVLDVKWMRSILPENVDLESS
jgi:monofunctional biosynthetic peptidoglycan transglycosylase